MSPEFGAVILGLQGQRANYIIGNQQSQIHNLLESTRIAFQATAYGALALNLIVQIVATILTGAILTELAISKAVTIELQTL